MRPSEDIGLIRKTARGDQQAFGRLYERHGRVAYNLARYILRNADDAEDAVQEAFVEVWRYASRFEPGNPRNWILRIVANKCFRKGRKERRGDELAGMAGPERNTDSVRPDVEAERAEMVLKLRGLLDCLPAPERNVVALYYGAGLTQQEVADALSMPQRSVSRKIAEILARLRGQLAQAGFGGATAWVTTERIGETVCSGHPAPAGLAQRVLQVATSGAAGSVRAGAAAASRIRLASVLPWLAVGMVVLAVGASVWWVARGPGDPATTGAGVKAEPKADAGAPASARLKLPIKWTFKNGPPEDLRCIYGEWKWKGGTGGQRPGMEAKDKVYVRLPLGLPKTPLQIIVRCRVSGDVTNTRLGTSVVRGRHVWPRVLYLPRKRPKLTQRSFDWRFYVWERRHAGYAGREPFVVIEYQREIPMDALCFGHHGSTIESLEIRAISIEEIPREVRARDLRASGLFKRPQRRLGLQLGEPTEAFELLP